MYKEKKLGKVWLTYGYNFKQVGVGLHIDRFNITIDLLFFFVTVEIPMTK